MFGGIFGQAPAVTVTDAIDYAGSTSAALTTGGTAMVAVAGFTIAFGIGWWVVRKIRKPQ